ncbi:hypothetical protein [Thalassoroseus pseudoceratinae]|uniref:hypothetical protein n=1 Tax=Thalassoroseus pseudoceratinae TaxID=2713176 RepID=UPI0014223BB0|nr:hypothetical protein [Thalassoroseus pseudoceratinae]
MTRFAHAYCPQLTFVGRFYGNAKLYHPSPTCSGTGRPRVKGERQPEPSFGLVPVSLVYVEDLECTHRSEYFYSSDPSWSDSAIVESYVSRWAIEVTFWECKARLGLGSHRRFSRLAVERVD